MPRDELVLSFRTSASAVEGLHDLLCNSLVVIVGAGRRQVACVAVDRDDALALLGLVEVHEGLLESSDELVCHDRTVLGDADGIVVDHRCDSDEIGVLPDGVLHSEGIVPIVLVVPSCIGEAAYDVDLTGSKAGEGGRIGVDLDSVCEIGDRPVVVALHEPHRRIYITGAAGGTHDRPVRAVEILPGEILTSIHLRGKLLTLVRR